MLIQANMPYIPLKSKTVQTVVTSIPYYGLRCYDIQPSIWGGDPNCPHEWQGYTKKGIKGGTASEKVQIKDQANFQIVPDQEQASCTCGAWLGQLGSEPTLEMFIDHTVQVFREVKRILRDDGTLWMNVGDSYAGSGGPGNQYDKGKHPDKFEKFRNANRNVDGIKNKDLMGVPWMVAFALRADGWYLRSDCIWHKSNGMPEPGHDRPTKSHEYVFFLSKSSCYYYDGEAVKEPVTGNTHSRGTKLSPPKEKANSNAGNGHKDWSKYNPDVVTSRNLRTVWTIPTQPFPEAHFATFPEALVEPCIKAGSKVDDIVYDPFMGSGTTGLVAQKLGRKWVGTDLGWNYLQMAKKRTGITALKEWEDGKKGETVVTDLPLFMR
jgi:DNA modification methylase